MKTIYYESTDGIILSVNNEKKAERELKKIQKVRKHAYMKAICVDKLKRNVTHVSSYFD